MYVAWSRIDVSMCSERIRAMGDKDLDIQLVQLLAQVRREAGGDKTGERDKKKGSRRR